MPQTIWRARQRPSTRLFAPSSMRSTAALPVNSKLAGLCRAVRLFALSSWPVVWSKVSSFSLRPWTATPWAIVWSSRSNAGACGPRLALTCVRSRIRLQDLRLQLSGATRLWRPVLSSSRRRSPTEITLRFPPRCSSSPAHRSGPRWVPPGLSRDRARLPARNGPRLLPG